MKIGLTYTGNEIKNDKYKTWLKAGDSDVEIIELHSDDRVRGLESFDACEALVLSGGVDIDPGFFGGEEDYPKKPPLKPERDKFEFDLLQKALDSNIPILGICRGLQLINCHFGGNLVQDLGDPRNMTHHKAGKDDRLHSVKIMPDTLLSATCGVMTGEINSAHHQSIDKLGNGLIVSAVSEDGVVEGIELADKKGKPFFLAVQWHPERMADMDLQASPLSKNIRDVFIQEIKSSK